jgi:hypothetical protein
VVIPTGLVKGSFLHAGLSRRFPKTSQSRTAETARLGAVLQDAGIKIDSVASSIATKSGRAMIEALIDGERRGGVPAELAKGKMRATIPDLTMALEGRFDAYHALMCRLHLDHIDHLDATLAHRRGVGAVRPRSVGPSPPLGPYRMGEPGYGGGDGRFFCARWL